MTEPTCSYCGAHAPCMVPSCPLKHLWPSPTSSDVERMREALKWALDEIDVLSNMLVKWAYPQGMAMIGREDQFDNYRAACVVRSLKQEGGS